jgi:hypothetical protein
MKTIALLAVLFAGSAFGEPIFTASDYDRMSADSVALSKQLSSAREGGPYIPSNAEACRPVKPTQVDYTIVTLPDGQTASALTFRD